MPIINSNVPITSNGDYFFERLQPGGRFILRVSGLFGGGTVTPGFNDGVGNFVAYRDASGAVITSTVATGWRFDIPDSAVMGLRVTGATAADIRIGLTPSNSSMAESANLGKMLVTGQDLGSGVATALAKPVGTNGSVQLAGDPQYPIKLVLPDMTGLVAEVGALGYKNGKLSVADNLTPGGNLVTQTRYKGTKNPNLSMQPKSGAFMKIVGIPIPAGKMTAGLKFRLGGYVVVYNGQFITAPKNLTGNIIGLCWMAGSTVPFSGGTGPTAWSATEVADITSLQDKFIRHDFMEVENFTVTDMGISRWNSMRTVSGAFPAHHRPANLAGIPTATAGVANELCIMLQLNSSDAGSYFGALGLDIDYDLTLEITS